MSSTWAIAARSLKLIPRIPSTFLPSLLMPVFMTVAFAGAFSGIALIPGFPAEKAIDWFLPMSALLAAGFSGVTTGMGVARELENGFYDRFLVSPASRISLINGNLLASALRSLIPLTTVLLLGLVWRANFKGGVMGFATLLLATTSMAVVSGAWSMAIAYRLKSQKGAPIMQTALFLGIFLSTAQMPLELLSGWLEHVARYNPLTPVMNIARFEFLGGQTWEGTWPGLVSLVGLFAVTFLFAARSLNRLSAD
jgi:ABC-2 type transport system permease protein